MNEIPFAINVSVINIKYKVQITIQHLAKESK